jgi:integrase
MAKTARQIPLSATMRELLTRRQHEYLATLPKPFNPDTTDADRVADLYVFGNGLGERIRDIRTAWQNTCERAGIDDLHGHDLRREAGSRKLEQGWPLHAVSKWLGHAKITMTATYLNVDADYLHELNERDRKLVLVKQ